MRPIRLRNRDGDACSYVGLGVAFSFYADFSVNSAIFSFPFQNSYKHVFLITLKYILLA